MSLPTIEVNKLNNKGFFFMYQSHLSYSSMRRRGQAPRSGSAPKRGINKQYIHPSKFIKAAKPVIDVEQYVPTNMFEDFNIHPMIKANIVAKGFTAPSPIQDQTIPLGLEGRDIVGIANTGTGKTAAFAIPIIHKLMEDRRSNAIIIAPTRELAEQIQTECKSYAKGSGIRGALLIGGSSMPAQLRDMRNRPNIVIGTPGRIKDHVERGTLVLADFNIVVLDEVDRMVDMGFIADIRYLLGKLASPRQSLFFSATIDPKIEGLINSFLTDPVRVSVKTGETSDNVEQSVIEYGHSSERISKLHDLLIQGHVNKILIFDETQRSVERLSKELQERGFSADAIHGGKTQGHRTRALNKFRNNEINILVATDVAARGIDVADITHVINYSTPNTYDDYIHRIGRAGRAGKTGHAITFVGQ
jgi:ATP-dependent RNA helicase RhlE